MLTQQILEKLKTSFQPIEGEDVRNPDAHALRQVGLLKLNEYYDKQKGLEILSTARPVLKVAQLGLSDAIARLEGERREKAEDLAGVIRDISCHDGGDSIELASQVSKEVGARQLG